MKNNLLNHEKKSTIIIFRNLSNNELFILPFVMKLAEILPADVIYIEDFKSADEIYHYLENEPRKTLNIFFLRFRWLMSMVDLQRKSSKKRIFYEQDAAQNYTNLTGTNYLGAWTKYLPLLHSDLIVVTDKRTRDQLLTDGIAAYWLPKAADSKFLKLENQKKKIFPIGYYGTRYGARTHALALMKKNNIQINKFSVPYKNLPEYISLCRAILICNSLDRYLFPWLKRIQKKIPLIFIQSEPGWQVMTKNYEVCAANSLMLADFIEEMSDLGFKSGVNCLLYRDSAEMVEMARWIVAHPDQADEMAEQGFRLVVERHTWEHRANDFSSFLKTGFLTSS